MFYNIVKQFRKSLPPFFGCLSLESNLQHGKTRLPIYSLQVPFL